MHRTFTALPFLVAFLACGSLSLQGAEGESSLAAEAPELAREVTFRIEGAVPHRSLCQSNLCNGSKAGLIGVLGVVVFGMLALIRGFNSVAHTGISFVFAGLALLLACGGVGAMGTLLGNPRYRLESTAGATPLANTVGDSDDTSVYIAVVEGEGSPANNLHPGRYLLLRTSNPGGNLPRGARLSVVVEDEGNAASSATEATFSETSTSTSSSSSTSTSVSTMTTH